jgi:uncharacterized protein YecT (DUF1311 family)
MSDWIRDALAGGRARRWLAALLLAAGALALPAFAQTYLEQCADESPTQSAIGTCMEQKLAEAERELAHNAKLMRDGFATMRGRETRARAHEDFDRAQRRFFTQRDRECGAVREGLDYSDRSNKVRDCMIRMTMTRSAQIASRLGPPAAPPAVKPQEATPAPEDSAADASKRASADPVYGADWHLIKMVRDNKEVPLPPKYRGTLRLEPDGRVSGFGAGSAFTGRFRIPSPGRIQWSENGFLISHDAQQADPSGVDYLYIDSLERVSRAGLARTGLVLRSEDGSVTLSFER